MILILGSDNFYQSSCVYQALLKLGHDACFINCDGESDLQIEFDDSKFSVLEGNRQLLGARVIWRTAKFMYRKYGHDQAWANEHVTGVMRRTNYENLISIFPGIVVNPQVVDRLSESKLLQLKIAQEVGFRVPRSLLSSNVKLIKDFQDSIGKCEEKVRASGSLYPR
ncbi:hypothetical protein ABT364_19780 [Massilia sp. SR12]